MRIVSGSKERAWNDELYRRAKEFHGHGGPFMVVGLRMGQTALDALDARGWFGIECNAMLHWSPPDSCVLDGIQVSTGCTTGKHNLNIFEEDGVASEFRAGDKAVLIKVSAPVLSEIRDKLTAKDTHGEDSEELIERLKTMPLDVLFEVERRTHSIG